MVSVIIPAYNYGRFLAECLDSVRLQTYADFECLIIDNGSSDNTKEVAQSYLTDPRFKYFYQQNRGVSAGRNKGIELAKGKYIQFLDADDLLQPEKLKLSVEHLENQPDCDLVYGGMRYFKDIEPGQFYKSWNCDDSNDPDWMKPFSGRGKDLAKLFLAGNNMVISSPLFRTSVINETEVFDEQLRYNEDWEFWLRLIFAGKRFDYIANEKAFSLIRVHQRSASADFFPMLIGGLTVLQKHRRRFEQFELSVEVGKRIQDHLQMIKSALLESSTAQFKKRVQLLKEKKLYALFFSKEFKSPFFAKLLLRFRKV